MGLKLTVKRGETIKVGKDIVITVNTLSNKQTQLQFDAPRSVKILRGCLEDYDDKGNR